jgi:hypothetical protein
MPDLVVFVGKVVLLGVIFIVPVSVFAWFQGRIKNRRLHWPASLAAVALSLFFLCSFVGLSLEPASDRLTVAQRLIASLAVVGVLTVIIVITLPLRRLALGLRSPFSARIMRRLRQRYPEELAKWEEKLGVCVDEEAG